METCGTLHKALWEKLCTDTLLEDALEIAYGHFATGFMSGQAEKVYSGACTAFMVRPGADWWTWACEAMQLICDHYGLLVYTDRMHGELWGCANGQARQEVHLVAVCYAENSIDWHTARARLCGIPPDKVDVAYHERAQWGERCEPVAQGDTDAENTDHP